MGKQEYEESYTAKKTARVKAREAVVVQEAEDAANDVKALKEKQRVVNERTLAQEKYVINNKLSEEQKRLEESLARHKQESERITKQINSDIEKAKAAHDKQQAQIEERNQARAAELEVAASTKTRELEKQTRADKARRDAESKAFKDSFDRKVAAAKQDMETRVYINEQLAAAHAKRDQVGDHVQKQVAGLAGATKNVAETIHYLHQRRVDGLNDGVTTRIEDVDDKISGLGTKIQETNKVTKGAIGRNNVRAHALAQDIIDRHGVGQFKKHKVCKTFRSEAKKEDENTDYWVAKDTGRNAYVEEKFIIPPPAKDSPDEDSRRRLASMTPSEQVLARRRLTNRPKSHIVVLEALLEEINRLN